MGTQIGTHKSNPEYSSTLRGNTVTLNNGYILCTHKCRVGPLGLA